MLSKLKPQIDSIFSQELSHTELFQTISQLLHSEVDHYDWVGFYLTDTTHSQLLKLGPYSGAETDHTDIPFGKGVCGQVAESNLPKVVPDVHQESNYLSCSITVKSEIVFPIVKNKKHYGQIDIDSNALDPFTESDLELLAYICRKIEHII